MKAKRLVKRRAKVTRKPAAESSDEEEESRKRRQRRRRRVCYVIVPALTTSHSEDEEIIISSEWETNKSFTEAKTKSAATLCGAEAAVNPVPHLTPSQSEDEIAISGGINISSEWKTNKSFAEKKTKSAAEAAVPPAPTLTSSDSEDEVAISGGINISSEWKTYKSFAEKKTKSAAEAAVPPAPTLTSSDSEDEVAISGGINISSEWKTYKSFAEEKKTKSAATPCLTDSSADEEEAEVVSYLDLEGARSRKVNTAEFRGGAGGSSNPVWRQLAERIMVGVRRARLPLRLPLDDITEGDGNCYFRALGSQLQRPEVAAPDHMRRLDHRSLRKKICNFMLKSKLTVVEDFKKNWLDFQDSQLGDYNRYWTDMRDSRGDIWAEGPVIHATAWFLERDIYLVSEKASVAEPFIAFSGNQDGTDASCVGAALWLGHLTGLHYQTLMPLPTERELMPARPELRKVEDTLKAKAKTGSTTSFTKPSSSKVKNQYS